MFFLLPAAFAATPAADLLDALEDHLAHGEGCLSPLVAEITDRADELSPADRARASRLLTPWKSDLRAPVQPLRSVPPPPAAMPSEPCFSLGENRSTSEHFAVEWDGNTISESTAQDFLDALEDGYRVEVEELGWLPPLGGDDYLLLAYVQSGSYQGAYTTVESCGGGYVPYIVAYSGSFSSRSWADTMAVHEFNHAVQFGYGFAWEFWWWEATATYIESQVYPDSDWWAYYVTGYTDSPQLAFNASDQSDDDIFWHMYGMAIWGAYVDEYLGGHDTVLATWEAAIGERGTYTFGMQEAFEELGLDFEAAYTDFVVRNVVMDYAAQRVLPSVDEESSIDGFPAEVVMDSGKSRPQGYGQTYTRFDAGSAEGTLVLSFEGDPDVEWSVQLVEASAKEVLRTVSTRIEGGAGELSLPDFGAEDVVLIISPLDRDDTRREYRFTADVVSASEEDTGGEAGTDPVADAEEGSGCGCDAAPGGPAALGALLGLAALARRRR